MSLAVKPEYSKRRVVVVRYFAVPGGGWQVEKPQCCALPDNTGACRIRIHRWRRRKCGPEHLLAGFHCRSHACYFTGYAASWLPFGRRPMVHVTPDNLDVLNSEDDLGAWSETAFGAVVDAAEHRPWPVAAGGFKAWAECHGREPYGVLKTQYRHVSGALDLFAITEDLAGERPAVAAALFMDMSDIEAAAQKIRDGPLLRCAGQKGAAVLSAVGAPRRRLLRGITRLGATRRFWGPPLDA